MFDVLIEWHGRCSLAELENKRIDVCEGTWSPVLV